MKGLRLLCADPPGSAVVTGTSTTIIDQDKERELLVIYTLGASNVWIAFHTNDAEVGKGLVLLANGRSRVLLDRSFMVTDRINMITESGANQTIHFQGFRN